MSNYMLQSVRPLERWVPQKGSRRSTEGKKVSNITVLQESPEKIFVSGQMKHVFRKYLVVVVHHEGGVRCRWLEQCWELVQVKD